MNWQKLKKTWRKKRCTWLRELSECAIVWLIAGTILSPIVGQSPIYYCIMVFFPGFFSWMICAHYLKEWDCPKKAVFQSFIDFAWGDQNE